MQVFFYQAECGDAARIRFLDAEGVPHNILIDSGHKKTYRYVLEQEIKSLISNGECIDMWVLSHIHDDHIGGVKKYIELIQRGEIKDIVKTWYYNPPRVPAVSLKPSTTNTVSSASGIITSDEIVKYLQRSGKLPETDIISDLPELDFFGLKFTFLGPPVNKLNALREKYKGSLPLEKEENQSISAATKAGSDDYGTEVDKFDLDKWSEDGSIENGSSISFITEFRGKKILWLADGHPSDVVNSLDKLGYSTKNKLKCDWVKVTHHASIGNNSKELFGLVECNNYLISADGVNRHSLPNKECLSQILRNPEREPNSEYVFQFTYDNTTLRRIFSVDGDEVFKKWRFQVRYLKDKFVMGFDLAH